MGKAFFMVVLVLRDQWPTCILINECGIWVLIFLHGNGCVKYKTLSCFNISLDNKMIQRYVFVNTRIITAVYLKLKMYSNGFPLKYIVEPVPH